MISAAISTETNRWPAEDRPTRRRDVSDRTRAPLCSRSSRAQGHRSSRPRATCRLDRGDPRQPCHHRRSSARAARSPGTASGAARRHSPERSQPAMSTPASPQKVCPLLGMYHAQVHARATRAGRDETQRLSRVRCVSGRCARPSQRSEWHPANVGYRQACPRLARPLDARIQRRD